MKPLVLSLAVIIAACATGPAAGQSLGSQSLEGQSQEAPSTTPGAADTLRRFGEAFNAHDAAAVGQQMTANVDYLGFATGRLSGRDAVTRAYGELFEADPNCRIVAEAAGLKQLAPGVVSVQGEAAVLHTSGDATQSDFTAVLVKQDGRWLISQIHESPSAASRSSAAPQLDELNWLLGSWVSDAEEGAAVVNTFQRVEGGAFVSRAYGDARSTARFGRQLFGWDPAEQTLRCWLFNADGTFGEGRVAKASEQKWTCTLKLTLPSGQIGSLTQVLERDGEDAFTVRTIDAAADGAALRNSKVVKFTRQMAAGE